MKKNKFTKVIICIFISISIIISVFIYKVNSTTNNINALKLQMDNFGKTEANLDKDKISNLLKKCYYENDNLAGFDSIVLHTPKTDIYQLNWTLKVMRNMSLNFDNNDYEKINNTFKQYLINENPVQVQQELDYLRTITNIYKNLHFEKYDENKLKDILNKHYDKKECLFFLKDNNETLQDKIVATSIITDILKNTEISIENIEEVKNKLKFLYTDDSMFTKSDITKSVINNGGVIIYSLNNLGFTSADFNQITNNKRIDWLNYWNNNLPSIIKSDIFSISIVDSIDVINKFYKHDAFADTNFLNNLFSSKKSFNFFGFSDTSMNVDPQFIYIASNFCKVANYQFPYYKELENFIKNSIECDFKKTSLTSFSPKENYYGLKFADNIGFKYNKSKEQKLISDWYLACKENSNINDYQGLKNLYYILLSCNEFNIDIKHNNDELLYNVIEYVKLKLKDNKKEDLNTNIIEIKTGLDIILLLSGKIPKVIQNEVIHYTNNIDVKNDALINSYSIYNLYYIIKYTNKENNITETLITNLDKLYLDGGYTYKQTSKESPDIISTTYAINIKTDFGKPFNNTSIKDFLNKLKVKDNLYKASETSNDYSTDLQILYYAYILSAL